ncbi:MAG: GMP synthase [Magnetococcales bacterium]|nr:GMP synthase [Magnetococcales bacterium]
MKIAFLHAGFPPESISPKHGDYLSMFKKSFLGCDTPIELVDFQVQKGELPNLEDCFDGYICCGSANSVYDAEPWIPPLLNFVKKLSKKDGPMVGICFGHQLIAKALGGRVEKAKTGWGLGNKPGKVLHDVAWMTPPLQRVNLLYSHQDQVVQLPKNSLLLISTDHCPNAAFIIANRFLAIQGHPEFEPPYLDALMESRRHKIGAELVDQAKDSLTLELNNNEVVRWIANFLLSAIRKCKDRRYQ